VPRYEYKCKKCDRNFEVTHSIHDSVETCEECGGEVRRVFHPVGILFKGSGFYATDSKKPDNKPARPLAEAGKESGKSGSGSDGNGKKEKPAGDKKPAGAGKTEKTAS